MSSCFDYEGIDMDEKNLDYGWKKIKAITQQEHILRGVLGLKMKWELILMSSMKKMKEIV